MRFLNRSAGRLSRHRRGPLAGLAVLLLGLLLTGGLYSTLSPGAQADETSTSAEDVQAGRELFLVGCAFCHGQNGEGVLTQSGTQYGPPLTDVGAASVDFQVGTGRMPMAQPGQQAVRKPPVYNEDEIRQLAAYVDSLGTGPAIPDASAYSLPDDLTEEERQEAISRGGQIFLTNCTACHNFDGSGGAMPRGGFAPTLRGVEAKHIYEALLTGPQSMPSFSDGNLTPDEKRDVIAYLKTTEEKPGYAGFSLGSLGPVSEGVAAWLIGIGGLVGAAIWIAAHTTRTDRKKPTDHTRVNLPSGAPGPDQTGAAS
ncbi:cytochrome bc1 complex diheme cytochrome c subunit [Nocardioides dongxiaopingii]|uniref:cytochrome bc1 complex diheme cytochrome c subunit n=1 Tax=Nocardioides TaxID=1839 RepID=UPI001484D3AB|nr:MULTISPECIES: c-type cytochrome [Nocardioides]